MYEKLEKRSLQPSCNRPRILSVRHSFSNSEVSSLLSHLHARNSICPRTLATSICRDSDSSNSGDKGYFERPHHAFRRYACEGAKQGIVRNNMGHANFDVTQIFLRQETDIRLTDGAVSRVAELPLLSVELVECTLQLFKLLSSFTEFPFRRQALVVGKIPSGFRDECVEIRCG